MNPARRSNSKSLCRKLLMLLTLSVLMVMASGVAASLLAKYDTTKFVEVKGNSPQQASSQFVWYTGPGRQAMMPYNLRALGTMIPPMEEMTSHHFWYWGSWIESAREAIQGRGGVQLEELRGWPLPCFYGKVFGPEILNGPDSYAGYLQFGDKGWLNAKDTPNIVTVFHGFHRYRVPFLIRPLPFLLDTCFYYALLVLLFSPWLGSIKSRSTDEGN
jgi:hypothetical protein